MPMIPQCVIRVSRLIRYELVEVKLNHWNIGTGGHGQI